MDLDPWMHRCYAHFAQFLSNANPVLGVTVVQLHRVLLSASLIALSACATQQDGPPDESTVTRSLALLSEAKLKRAGNPRPIKTDLAQSVSQCGPQTYAELNLTGCPKLTDECLADERFVGFAQKNPVIDNTTLAVWTSSRLCPIIPAGDFLYLPGDPVGGEIPYGDPTLQDLQSLNEYCYYHIKDAVLTQNPAPGNPDVRHAFPLNCRDTGTLSVYLFNYMMVPHSGFVGGCEKCWKPFRTAEGSVINPPTDSP